MEYKDPGILKFTNKIIDAGGGGAFLEFPYSVIELFGVKGRVPVTVVFDDRISYQGSLVNMGTGCHVLIILKKIRAQLGKEMGDEVAVELKLDSKPRVIEIPQEVKKKLQQFPQALDFFNSLSYSHQREYVNWIAEAKQAETKERRMEKMVQMLLDSQKLN